MANLDDLYPPENRRDAITGYGEGTLIALAGPGTGKTTALLKRVRSLTLDRGIDPRSVAYVTFIREITRKFEQDLEDEFEAEAFVPDIRVSTLHGLALRLIRNHGKTIGIAGQEEPVSTEMTKDLLALTLQRDIVALLEQCGLSAGLGKVRTSLQAAKTEWQQGVQDPQLPKGASRTLEAFQRLADAYELVDWDQVVLYASRICDSLRALPDWLLEIRHFLIDEYQDFNPSEQTLLESLTQHSESVVITGDDDQSLYSFRGAYPSGIVALDSDPSLDHVSLVYSWRCRDAITGAASCFLRWMRDDARELLARETGGVVRAYSFASANIETSWLAARLKELLQSIPHDASAEDGIACLFPKRDVLSAYKDVLRGHGVPCSVPRAVGTDPGTANGLVSS